MVDEKKTSLIDSIFRKIEERKKRLDKIDELIGQLQFVVDEAGSFLYNMVDDYYGTIIKTPITKEKFLTDPFVKWLMEEGHIVPERTKRHSKLIKNLVIAMVQAGFNGGEFKEIAEKMCANMPGKTVKEFTGWRDYIMRDKDKEWRVNYKEIKEVIEEARGYD